MIAQLSSGEIRGISIGSLILAFFGAVWLALAAFYFHRLNWKWLLAIAVGCALLCVSSVRQMPGAASVPAASAAGVGQIVGYASAAEGTAIFLAIVLLKRRAPTYIMSAIAIIVGLHFIPLAAGLGFRQYYVTGCGIAAAAVVLGFVRNPALRQGGTCLATGLALWATAAVLLISVL